MSFEEKRRSNYKTHYIALAFWWDGMAHVGGARDVWHTRGSAVGREGQASHGKFCIAPTGEGRRWGGILKSLRICE